jgi:hypothetical protein
MRLFFLMLSATVCSAALLLSAWGLILPSYASWNSSKGERAFVVSMRSGSIQFRVYATGPGVRVLDWQKANAKLPPARWWGHPFFGVTSGWELSPSGPPRFWTVGLPFWLIAGLAAVPLLPGFHRRYRQERQRRRLKAGCCMECGYDLRASTGRCPECGEPISRACEASSA